MKCSFSVLGACYEVMHFAQWSVVVYQVLCANVVSLSSSEGFPLGRCSSENVNVMQGSADVHIEYWKIGHRSFYPNRPFSNVMVVSDVAIFLLKRDVKLQPTVNVMDVAFYHALMVQGI